MEGAMEPGREISGLLPENREVGSCFFRGMKNRPLWVAEELAGWKISIISY